MAGTKVWDDVHDIEAITSMPDEVTHRITDKVGVSIDSATKYMLEYTLFDKEVVLNYLHHHFIDGV